MGYKTLKVRKEVWSLWQKFEYQHTYSMQNRIDNGDQKGVSIDRKEIPMDYILGHFNLQRLRKEGEASRGN